MASHRRGVRPLRDGEQAAAVAIMAKSFADSPFGVWLYRDAAVRDREFTALFTSVIAKPTTVADVTDDLLSVAFWEAPAEEEAPQEPAEKEKPDASTDSLLRAETGALFAAVDAAKPKVPGAWYLGFVGSQAKGGGRALIQHRLSLIGQAPATLWTPAEALVPFYASCGFELVSRHDVDGASAFWMKRGGGQ